jgi:hypothetical protein
MSACARVLASTETEVRMSITTTITPLRLKVRSDDAREQNYEAELVADIARRASLAGGLAFLMPQAE